ncbi:MAG: 4'-phosphopantetheinyl transferase family protein, partial [Stackebrandtia sp.]
MNGNGSVQAAGSVGVLLAVADAPLGAGELTHGERAALARLPQGPRVHGWLTGRRALRRALSACRLPADTSAYRFPCPLASLSHSSGRSAAAVVAGPPDYVAGVGVDIELDRTPDPRTASFFLTETERSWLARAPEPVKSAALLRLWT